MLEASLAGQLKSLLEKLTLPIELVSSLDDGPKSVELAELLTQIAAMSEKITYERRDDDTRRPSFAVRRSGTDIEVRFAGIPLGHEFTSLALALLQVGGHRRRRLPNCSSRSVTSTATSTSRPTSRCPARTAPTWCRP